jgi:hypothetical protein
VTTGFSRVRRGGAYARFDVGEASLVASLAGQVVELLLDGVPDPQLASPDDDDPLDQLVGMDGPVSRPDDPVLVRLLPDGYSEDEDGADEANADFRRYTERGLRDGKVANAQAVIASLQVAGAETAAAGDPVDVELDAAGVQAWLRCLNDMRLAIGTRLEVAEGDDERWETLPDDDPARAMHDVYDWLGFVQETLVRTLR